MINKSCNFFVLFQFWALLFTRSWTWQHFFIGRPHKTRYLDPVNVSYVESWSLSKVTYLPWGLFGNSHSGTILIKKRENVKHQSGSSMLKLKVKDRLCKIMVNQQWQITGNDYNDAHTVNSEVSLWKNCVFFFQILAVWSSSFIDLTFPVLCHLSLDILTL
jgi:hypothetical protein